MSRSSSERLISFELVACSHFSHDKRTGLQKRLRGTLTGRIGIVVEQPLGPLRNVGLQEHEMPGDLEPAVEDRAYCDLDATDETVLGHPWSMPSPSQSACFLFGHDLSGLVGGQGSAIGPAFTRDAMAGSSDINLRSCRPSRGVDIRVMHRGSSISVSFHIVPMGDTGVREPVSVILQDAGGWTVRSTCQRSRSTIRMIACRTRQGWLRITSGVSWRYRQPLCRLQHHTKRLPRLRRCRSDIVMFRPPSAKAVAGHDF